MEKFEDKIVSANEAHKILLDLLEGIGSVKEEDIQTLESEFDEEFKEIFNKFDAQKKMVYTFVHKLPEDELKKSYELLIKNRWSNEYILAFHDFRKAINVLRNKTIDPKYNFIDEMRKET